MDTNEIAILLHQTYYNFINGAFQRSSKDPTAVPFILTNEGHILVTGTINDVAGKFIFDTGVGMTLLSKKYANKINGLQKQDAGFTGLRETGQSAWLT
jgi:predicted aspartyl protease